MRLLEGLMHRVRSGTPLAVCATFLLAFAGWAKADFIISSARYSDGADDVVVFSALNTDSGLTAGSTKLQSLNFNLTSMTSGSPLIFDSSQDIDGDGQNDINVLGYTDSFPTSQGSTMPGGSFIRIGAFATFVAPGATPQAYTGGELTAAQVHNNYTNLYTFNIQGGDFPSGGGTDGGVVDTVTPAPFAVALVAKGAVVEVTGTLTGDMASQQDTVSPAISAPEPASVGLLCIAATYFGLRRRRQGITSASDF